MAETCTRRAILQSLAAVGSGTLAGRAGLAATAPARSIVDVHHHVYPPAYVAELARANQPAVNTAKDWTVEKSLADMDKAGVATAIGSITTPGVTFVGEALGQRLARESNEFMARLATDHPGRFGFFAILPWPDAGASLKEIEFALDTLHADGIGMLTSYGDKFFGDPYFAPIFEELNRRKAVVYTHPTPAECCRNPLAGIPDTIVEYGTDTSRAITRTVFSGTSQKYPDMRLIFSHAGGSMPFMSERMVNLAKTPQYAKQLPNGFLPEAAKFFYDTAQASNAAAMSALKKVAPVSQIVFGTDYPFRTAVEHVENLKACGVFNGAELRAIERENAVKLLPRRR